MSYIAQYAVLGFSGVISAASLLAISLRPSSGVFWSMLGLWLVVLAIAYTLYATRVRVHEQTLPLLIGLFLGSVGLVSLIEQGILRAFLAFFVGGIVGFVFYWSLFKQNYPTFIQKQFRRMVTMIWVFIAYALTTTLFGFNLFFPHIPFWLLGLFGAFVFAISAAMIWTLYYSVPLKSHALSMALVGLLMVELIWALNTLPFGYLVLGFFATWLWYIVQLLFRFHFSDRGVVWKKQLWFLGSNAALFVAILFFVRWI